MNWRSDTPETVVVAFVNPQDPWWYFGYMVFDCDDVDDKRKQFYLDSPPGSPPRFSPPCDKCWKGLIFWRDQYSQTNLANFLKALPSLGCVSGKLNDGVVVFYFTSSDKVLEFMPHLTAWMQEHNIKGKVQWRRACKGYQDLRPDWWYSAKELKNVI